MKKAAVLALLLAGCARDPATEPPVELQPGLYEVQVGGGTVVELKSGERTERICFYPPDALTFPNTPLYATVGNWDGCSDTPDDPRGNAISGKRQCLDRRVPLTATYAGSHTTDSFELRGTVTQSDDEGGSVMHLGSGDFTITGKRIAPCEG